jgi:hypothetical protein
MFSLVVYRSSDGFRAGAAACAAPRRALSGSRFLGDSVTQWRYCLPATARLGDISWTSCLRGVQVPRRYTEVKTALPNQHIRSPCFGPRFRSRLSDRYDDAGRRGLRRRRRRRRNGRPSSGLLAESSGERLPAMSKTCHCSTVSATPPCISSQVSASRKILR